MDKLIQLYSNFLDEILIEYKKNLEDLPDWRLNSYLPKAKLSLPKKEKYKWIIKKYQDNDKIYFYLDSDLRYLKKKNSKKFDLKILTIDDKLLDSNGYSETQKYKLYTFIKEIRKLI